MSLMCLPRLLLSLTSILRVRTKSRRFSSEWKKTVSVAEWSPRRTGKEGGLVLERWGLFFCSSTVVVLLLLLLLWWWKHVCTEMVFLLGVVFFVAAAAVPVTIMFEQWRFFRECFCCLLLLFSCLISLFWLSITIHVLLKLTFLKASGHR